MEIDEHKEDGSLYEDRATGASSPHRYRMAYIYISTSSPIISGNQNYLYGASARATAASSGSHLSPFANSFSLLYRSSSLVSVAYSALGAG